MRSWSKHLIVFAASCVVLGCASSGGSDTPPGTMNAQGQAQAGGEKMAASGCMNHADGQRQQCEQKCPAAKGDEHFSIQHKLAMEHAACKEQCGEAHREHSMGCKMKR